MGRFIGVVIIKATEASQSRQFDRGANDKGIRSTHGTIIPHWASYALSPPERSLTSGASELASGSSGMMILFR